ncbi:hypothetical protein ACFVMC_00330 [Nocardia sp. NPDC127579]|uniref:hypothetical protein n=1 Tax=Nocardia sp. NPDC127579 TaxID=3345402 RepID=UPI00364218F9
MQPLQAPYGEQFEVLRGARDRVGDKTPAVVATLERCVYWTNVPAAPDGGYPTTARESAALTSTLGVPKDQAAVRHTDQVRRVATGALFSVVGPAQWDGVHPMTGWDPGYVTYTLKAVTG